MRALCRAVTALAGLALVGIAAGVPAQAMAMSRTSPGWSVVASPNPRAVFDRLSGVSCAPDGHCVAVGYSGHGSAGTAALAESWNGRRWSLMSTPPIGDPAVLEQVSCSSAAWCMAVGYFVAGGEDQPLTLAWNGQAWSRLTVPAVPGADDGQLTGVSCLSRSDCVAAGWTNNDSQDTALIARFGGIAWKLATITGNPGLDDELLAAISCSTRTWCVAVGGGTEPDPVAIALTSTNQKTWTYSTALKLPPAESGFYGVSCTGTKTCTAFGWGTAVPNKSFQWVVETGDGNTWRDSLTPQPAKTIEVAGDMACSSSGECVIVGSQIHGITGDTAPPKFASLIMTWNGRKLSAVPSPAVPGFAGTELNGVTCRAGACLAVGAKLAGPTSRTLVERS
jgi:hypothetical protein